MLLLNKGSVVFWVGILEISLFNEGDLSKWHLMPKISIRLKNAPPCRLHHKNIDFFLPFQMDSQTLSMILFKNGRLDCKIARQNALWVNLYTDMTNFEKAASTYDDVIKSEPLNLKNND
jgi:hypothetical protein